jgi:hypothetical protein
VNDDEMLATMRSSLTAVAESMTDVRLDRPVGTIQARARGRRLRRGLAGAATTGLALGVGLALAAGGGSPAGARPVHVNLDAWSVDTLSSGLVYLDVRQLQNPVLLRQTLAAAGVPAIVTFGDFCTGPGGGGTENLQQVLGKTALQGEPKLTINPARIPQGSELSIGIISASKNGRQGLDAAFALVPNGAQLTCGQPDTNPADKGKSGQPSPSASGTGGSGTVKTGLGS